MEEFEKIYNRFQSGKISPDEAIIELARLKMQNKPNSKTPPSAVFWAADAFMKLIAETY